MNNFNYACISTDPLTISFFKKLKPLIDKGIYLEYNSTILESIVISEKDSKNNYVHVDGTKVYSFTGSIATRMFDGGKKAFQVDYEENQTDYSVITDDSINRVKLDANGMVLRENRSFKLDREVFTSVKYEYGYQGERVGFPTQISVLTTNRSEGVERQQLFRVELYTDKTEDVKVNYTSLTLTDARTKKKKKLIGFYHNIK